MLGCEHDSIFPAVLTLHAIDDIQLWKYRTRFWGIIFVEYSIIPVRINRCRQTIRNLTSTVSGSRRDPHRACPHPTRASWDLQLWQRKISSEVTFEQRYSLCFSLGSSLTQISSYLNVDWITHFFSLSKWHLISPHDPVNTLALGVTSQ